MDAVVWSAIVRIRNLSHFHSLSISSCFICVDAEPTYQSVRATTHETVIDVISFPSFFA
ncbi:hypothetical protein Csa_001915, partial [Cucumis sativus]